MTGRRLVLMVAMLLAWSPAGAPFAELSPECAPAFQADETAPSIQFCIRTGAPTPYCGGLSASVPPAEAAPTQQNAQPPSDAELHARGEKLTENQHNDDAALEEYERVEHQVERTGGATPKVLDDKTFRVVPSGFGTFKLLIKTDDRDVDSAEYHRQLLAWRDVLELALRPGDSRAKAATAKWEKKKHDRAELVDASRDAFVPKWLGQETRNGHLCDLLELNPDPNFHPHSLFQEALTRVTAKIWVDHATDQLVRGEARVVRDLSIGGGILGKLYRGGVFSLEQAEFRPGVWLPVRYQYDFAGRKFLFTFEEHQYIEVSHYRRIGTPKQALAVVQSELASGKAFTADP